MKAFNTTSTQGIKDFFTYLKDKVQTFTPNDDFRSYINIDTNEPSWSKGEGDYLNYVMGKCVQFCNDNDLDINDIINSIQ